MKSISNINYKYDEFEVLETVIMGNERLYQIMKEKDALYSKEDFSDEDGIKASELEASEYCSKYLFTNLKNGCEDISE